MIYHYIESFIKNIIKNRFFYSINLVGFITGFLLVATISSFIYQELSFDNFHRNIKNIYRLHADSYGVTPLCFADKLKDKIPGISGIVRFSSGNMQIVDNNKTINLGKVYYPDPGGLKVFFFRLLSGNKNTALQNHSSIVIDRSTAEKLFGNSIAIGKTIKSGNGQLFTITGIMEDIPYNSHLRANAFIPIETLKSAGDKKSLDCKTWSILTYVLLSDNMNRIQVEKKINNLLENFLMGHGDKKMKLILEPLNKIYFDSYNNKYDGCNHGNKQTVILYMAISIMILIIVIINYINLSLVISGSRIKEIAIRRICGATGSDISWQVLVESLGVALISFLMVLFIVKAFLSGISTLLNIPVSGSIKMTPLFLYFFAGAVITGLVTGMIPGITLSKISEIKALKNDSIFSSRGFLRKLLLVFQLIIVAVLINSTLIINSQIRYTLNKDLGFNYSNIVFTYLTNPSQDKKDMLKNDLLKNPQIKGVSFSDELLGGGFPKAPVNINDNEILCYFYSIDPDYVSLYHLSIVKGRNFSTAMKTDFNSSCIINESAQKAFDLKDPLTLTARNKKIIGVVKDFNYNSLHSSIEPMIISFGSGRVMQIRISDKDQNGTLQYIKKTLKNFFPDSDGDISFLSIRIRDMYKPESDQKNSFAVYSVITLFISLLGLFGLTLFRIKKKTMETAIRKLFGAQLADTFKMFVREQLWIALVSNIIAVPVSVILMKQWLKNFQYRVDIGMQVFLITFLIIVFFTVAAISVFIIRTHRINLSESLKQE